MKLYIPPIHNTHRAGMGARKDANLTSLRRKGVDRRLYGLESPIARKTITDRIGAASSQSRERQEGLATIVDDGSSECIAGRRPGNEAEWRKESPVAVCFAAGFEPPGNNAIRGL